MRQLEKLEASIQKFQMTIVNIIHAHTNQIFSKLPQLKLLTTTANMMIGEQIHNSMIA